MKNYWQILGLEEGASQDEIKKAYKKYAKKFHPDLHGNDEFFKEKQSFFCNRLVDKT